MQSKVVTPIVITCKTALNIVNGSMQVTYVKNTLVKKVRLTITLKTLIYGIQIEMTYPLSILLSLCHCDPQPHPFTVGCRQSGTVDHHAAQDSFN